MEHHHIEITEEHFDFNSKTKNFVFMLIALGLICTLAGVFMLKGEAGNMMEKRFWGSMLMAGYYTTLISLCGTVFIGINYLSNAGWSAAIKRVPEAMGQYLPIGVLTLITIFFVGKEYVFEWSIPEIMDNDSLLQGKSSFLNSTFFVGGSIVFFGLYYFFTRYFRRLSIKEDKEKDVKIYHTNRRVAGGFMAIFGFTFPVISWMWMMSIDPHWFSTIYSIYNFAILWVCGITTICMFVLFLKGRGYLKIVTEEHLHDLGKMMFAFSIFWTYIWVSQYLLIWYANLPEEAIYYTERKDVDFGFQFWFNLIINFAAPLLILMTKNAKRKRNTLITAGMVIIGGHWNDLYLMVMPGVVGEEATIGLMEIGPTVFFFGVFIYVTLASLAKQSLIAVGHPYIKESALHEITP